jgi:predicted TIM-barrel fold metal-dependent hydrolase
VSVPVFDAHVHIERGLDAYDLDVAGKNIIFNDVASYRSSRDRCLGAGDTASLILDFGADAEYVRDEVASGRVAAVKIHSRIQGIGAAEWPKVADALTRIPARVPTIVDGFYFGRDLEHQPSLSALVDLLTAFPERSFVVAHSGGYKILEYFFHLREFSNVYYELALSLQYLEDSSAFTDLRKLIRHTDKSKIIFGSDYPYGSPARQCLTLREVCSELEIPEADVDRMLYRNAAALFRRDLPA